MTNDFDSIVVAVLDSYRNGEFRHLAPDVKSRLSEVSIEDIGPSAFHVLLRRAVQSAISARPLGLKPGDKELERARHKDRARAKCRHWLSGSGRPFVGA